MKTVSLAPKDIVALLGKGPPELLRTTEPLPQRLPTAKKVTTPKTEKSDASTFETVTIDCSLDLS